MLEQRVRGMIRAERRAHRPDGDVVGSGVLADEWDRFVADVLVVLPLHPAAMKRMRAGVGERIGVVQIHRVGLHASGVDVLRDRVDEPLPLVFALVAAARRKQDHRRPPVAVDDDRHVTSEPRRVPAVHLAPHARPY